MPSLLENRPADVANLFPDTPAGRQQMADSIRQMQKLNQGKTPPRMDPRVIQLSREIQVYIFNIGPRKHTLENMGSLGAWNVLRPALTNEQYHALDGPRQRGYVKVQDNLWCAPFAIPGIPWEPVWREGNKGEAQFYGDENEEDTGFKLAQSIIGIGRNIARRASLEKFGVFVSRTNPPKPEEVAKAQKELRKNFQAEVNEANEAHKIGKFLGAGGIAQPYHWEAARALGKTKAECPWMDEVAEAASPIQCPFCGTPAKVGQARCANAACGEIIDQEAYEAAKAKVAAGKKK